MVNKSAEWPAAASMAGQQLIILLITRAQGGQVNFGFRLVTRCKLHWRQLQPALRPAGARGSAAPPPAGATTPSRTLWSGQRRRSTPPPRKRGSPSERGAGRRRRSAQGHSGRRARAPPTAPSLKNAESSTERSRDAGNKFAPRREALAPAARRAGAGVKAAFRARRGGGWAAWPARPGLAHGPALTKEPRSG